MSASYSSDGDNLQFDQNALYAIWTEDSLRGDIPVGTTLAAGLQEINPFLLEWYDSHKSDNDLEFGGRYLRHFNSYAGEIIRRRGMMSGWNLTGNGWHRPEIFCGLPVAYDLWNGSFRPLYRRLPV